MRHDDLGLREVVAKTGALSESAEQTLVLVVQADGIPLMPACLREALQNLVHGSADGRRRRRRRQDAQTGTLEACLALQRILEFGVEGVPGANALVVLDHLRPVGVVEVQERRLALHAQRSAAGRMIQIAFELRRTPEMILGQHAGGKPAVDMRGGVILRPPRDDILRLAHIGNDLLERLPCTADRARERERGTHDLQELPTINAFGRQVRTIGELTLHLLLELLGSRELLEAAPVVRPRDSVKRCSSSGPKGRDIERSPSGALPGDRSSN